MPNAGCVLHRLMWYLSLPHDLKWLMIAEAKAVHTASTHTVCETRAQRWIQRHKGGGYTKVRWQQANLSRNGTLAGKLYFGQKSTG